MSRDLFDRAKRDASRYQPLRAGRGKPVLARVLAARAETALGT